MARENAVVKINPVYDGNGEDAPVVGLTVQVGERTETVRFAELSGDIATWALYFGLQTKIRNGAAISRDPATGLPASEEDKAAGVFKQVAGILAGEWTAARGEQGPRSGGLLFDAFKREYPDSRHVASGEAFAAFVKAFAAQNYPNESEEDGLKAARKTLREQPRIATAINAIKAERAAKATPKPAKPMDLDSIM